jgi:hypothetical protein
VHITGQRLLGKIRGLLRVWHCREETTEARWQRAMAKMRGEVLAVARGSPIRNSGPIVADIGRNH